MTVDLKEVGSEVCSEKAGIQISFVSIREQLAVL